LIKHSAFHDCDIYLDREQYENCVFYNCNLIYSGHHLHMVGTKSYGCRWVFVGPAGHTIKALATMYRQVGGAEFVEKLFADMRTGFLVEFRTAEELKGGAN
jgi:hypothetical protein